MKRKQEENYENFGVRFYEHNSRVRKRIQPSTLVL
jgi:hypothetical protein